MSVWPVSDGGMKEIWKGKNWEIWQQFNNFIWQLWQQAVDTKSGSWDKQQQREQSFLSFAPAIPVLDFI